MSICGDTFYNMCQAMASTFQLVFSNCYKL